MAIVGGKVLVNGVEFSPALLAGFIQESERGLEYFPSCSFLFQVGARGIGDAQNPDHPGECESLQHQGHQNYAERQKDNQVALGKRAAVGQGLGQCDGGSERDHSAHASPAQDQNALHGWTFQLLMQQAGPGPISNVGAGKNPDYAQRNDQCAEQSAVEEKRAVAVIANSGQDVRQLQADQDKDQAIEDKIQGPPNRPGLQSHLRREKSG